MGYYNSMSEQIEKIIKIEILNGTHKPGDSICFVLKCQV